MTRKIPDGATVTVHGWVMLKGVRPGAYRVEHTMTNGWPTYTFYRAGGRKPLVVHYVNSVDPWVRNDSDNNKITVN